MLKKFSEFSKRHATFARYVPLILWIGVILFMSSGEASMAETSRFIRPLLEFLFPNASAATIDLYHGYIRKSAHFTEYGILALLAAAAFFRSSRPVLRNFWFVAATGLVPFDRIDRRIHRSFEPRGTSSPWTSPSTLPAGGSDGGHLLAFHPLSAAPPPKINCRDGQRPLLAVRGNAFYHILKFGIIAKKVELRFNTQPDHVHRALL